MRSEKKFVFIFLFSVLVLSLVGFAYAANFKEMGKAVKENFKGEVQNFVNSTSSHQGDVEIQDPEHKVRIENNSDGLMKEGESIGHRNNSIARDVNEIKEKAKELRDKFEKDNRTDHENELENESEHFFVNRNGTRKEVRIKKRISDGEMEREIEFEGYNVSSKLKLKIAHEKDNVEMRVNLSNGEEKEIKILPNVASQTAINVFKNKNITVELKEVKRGNNTAIVYEASSEKRVRLFGLFNVVAPLKTQIDSETGKVINFNKPWWYFLTSEISKVVIPSNSTSSNETNSTTNVTANETENSTTNVTANETENSTTNVTANETENSTLSNETNSTTTNASI